MGDFNVHILGNLIIEEPLCPPGPSQYGLSNQASVWMGEYHSPQMVKQEEAQNSDADANGQDKLPI